MEQIGYALVSAQNEVVQTWGNTLGQLEGLPDVIVLANGNRVRGAKAGETFSDFRLLPRFGQLGDSNATVVEQDRVVTTFAVTAAHVKAEAQRRIIALTGATSLDGCFIKQFNANMRATELNDKRVSGDVLTVEEEAEAAALRALAAATRQIRAKSNALEAMAPIPADYTSDAYWT